MESNIELKVDIKEKRKPSILIVFRMYKMGSPYEGRAQEVHKICLFSLKKVIGFLNAILPKVQSLSMR